MNYKPQGLTFLLIASTCIFLFACSSSGDKKTTTTTQTASPSANQPPMAVEYMIVNPSLINEKIEVPGSLMAYESTEIHPEISGRLVLLNIVDGKYVSQGELLAKIYDGDLQAQLKKLEVQLEIANTNEQRSAQLLKIQAISQSDYDASQLNVNNIKADMAIIRTNLTKTEIRAPFSGKLGLKNISPGAFVSPTSILTTINQVNKLKLQFTIPEKYGAEIKKGQLVSFSVTGSVKSFAASVIASEASIQEDTRNLTVRAVVDNNDPVLIPGAFANVKMTLGNNPNALMIPNIAVVPQGRKKQVYLFKASKAMQTEITTGYRDSANVQVLSGLNTGDTLITSGLLFLRPGADVKLTKSKKADSE